MSDRSQRVPDWLVERLVAGELDAARAADVRERLAREEGGLGRVDTLQASNREILDAHTAADVVAEIKRRSRRTASAQPRAVRRWGWAALPLAGAAAVMFLYVGQKTDSTSETVSPAEERIKGLTPRLRVYRKEGDKVRRLSEGALVRPRDTLQLAYVAGGRAYGAVVSLDGRGVVTLHLPEQSGESPRLAANGEVPLPHAYELDSAPGFERFVFVTASRPFPVADITRVLQEGQPLPADFVQTVFSVRKESSP